MLYTQTVEGNMLPLIKRFSADKTFQDFRLVGGTALSLQLGHRKSVDIDLFTDKAFDATKISEHLKDGYQPSNIAVIQNGVFSRVDGIKVDMLNHQYKWSDASVEHEGIRMASMDEIAAMKVHAIVQSGKRLKDFVDMHVLLEHRSMEDILGAYRKKYPDANEEIAKMALLYHKEVKRSENVQMLDRKLSWGEVTKRLQEAIQSPDKKFRTQKMITSLKQFHAHKPRRRKNI